MRKLTTALLILVLALSLCACGIFGKKDDGTTHTITFESNGGEETVPSVNVPNGETATMPIPTKDGYVFVGWYLDAEFTNRYFFDYPLSGDTTLHAKFYDITSGEYVVISNVDQLAAIKDDPTAKYLLACDINCQGRTLVPVDEFTGELDGNGYKLHNFAMNENANNVALIRTNRGTVKNLSFDDYTYDVVRNAGADKFYGVVCGINYGTIDNCAVFAGNMKINCSGYQVHYTLYTGGIVGQNYGTVSNVKNAAHISINTTVSGDTGWGDSSGIIYGLIGGIAGSNANGATMDACMNTGDIEIKGTAGYVGRNDFYAGGIVALNAGTLVASECANDISVSSTGSVRFWVGGAVGSDTGSIETCSAKGNITIESDGTAESYTGGFVGRTTGVIENCASYGEIKVTNPGTGTAYHIGGFVGYTCGKLYNCYSTNHITDSTVDIKAIGGFAGYNEKLTGEEFLINKCFATGNIILQGVPVNAGKFVGLTTGTEKECYYLDTMVLARINVVDNVETQVPIKTTNDIGEAKAESELLSVDFLENTMYFDRMVWFLAEGKLPELR